MNRLLCAVFASFFITGYGALPYKRQMLPMVDSVTSPSLDYNAWYIFGGGHFWQGSRGENSPKHNFESDHSSSAKDDHDGGVLLGSFTNFAYTSAIEAKTAAENQKTAESQAAYGAQSGLAQAAKEAASTAQAALIAKQIIVQDLKHQLHEAEKQLQSEIVQYHQAKEAASAAQETAQQSQQQLSALIAALTFSQSSAQQSAQAAEGAAKAATAQHDMIIAAKQRVQFLLSKLHHALSDLHDTEASVKKALATAEEAQSNAAEDADDPINNTENGKQGGESGGDGGSKGDGNGAGGFSKW